MKSFFHKLLIFCTIIVLVCVGTGIFYAKDFGLGYKYYEQFTLNPIGVTQQENFMATTIEEYIENLEDNGFFVVSHNLDIELLCKRALINKNEINEETLRKQIINNLTVEVFLYKLNIQNDNTLYYFKTENEAKNFINQLNMYITQEYSIENVMEDYSYITSQDVLNNKLNSIIEQKRVNDDKVAAERKQKSRSVTSRGRESRTSSGGVPMASYKYISSRYGSRSRGWHTGTDFAAPAGTEVYAWKSGAIVMARWNGNYGNFIEIKHDDNTVSRYAHLKGYTVSKGQRVEQGQVIGYVGSTGNSTGPHLHFEIKINDSFVNPLNYL